jgi:hypothetical protein
MLPIDCLGGRSCKASVRRLKSHGDCNVMARGALRELMTRSDVTTNKMRIPYNNYLLEAHRAFNGRLIGSKSILRICAI